MKKYLFVGVSLCIILLLWAKNYNKSNLDDYIHGRILLNPPKNEGGGGLGLMLYDLKDKDYQLFLKDNFFAPEDYKDDVVLLADYSDYGIFTYNFLEDKLVKIMDSEHPLHSAKFIDGKNRISYINLNQDLIIYDVIKNEKETLLESIKYYCWSNDGNTLLYCERIAEDDQHYNIKAFDMIEKKTSMLIDNAYNPLLSKDGSKLLYFTSEKSKMWIVLKDLNTGKEKKIASKSTSLAKFSADSKFLILERAKFLDRELIIWDFINNKWKTIFPNIKSFVFFCVVD